MNARWKQLGVNPSAAFSHRAQLHLHRSSRAKHPDKPPPALAGSGSSRRLQPTNPSPRLPCPLLRFLRPPLYEASRGSEKLICSTDELHRATSLRENAGGGSVGPVWKGMNTCGLESGAVVLEGGGGVGGQSPSMYKFAYVSAYLHKLDATHALRFQLPWCC